MALALTVESVLTYRDFPIDLIRFAGYGVDILHGRLGRVYAGDWNESGPLQLLQCAFLQPLTGSVASEIAVHLLGNLVLLWAVCAGSRWLRRWAGLGPSAAVEVAAGLIVVALLIPNGRRWDAHPAEWVVPALWVAAAVASRDGRALRAGALLGLSTGWETFAVIAVPVLLLLPSRRDVARAVAVAAAVTLAWYLPFAAAGHFGLFGHVWPMLPDTLAHLLFPHLADATWLVRVLQAAVAMSGCAAAVVLCRRSVTAIWLAPLTAVVLRYPFDPYVLDYYWLPVTVLTLAGIALLSRRTPRPHLVALPCIAYLPYVLFWAPAVQDLLALALVAALLLTARRRESALWTAPVEPVPSVMPAA